jgi:hypothetical protein
MAMETTAGATDPGNVIPNGSVKTEPGFWTAL